MSEYRVLQVFLARETGAVSEVSYRSEEPPNFRCTCGVETGKDCMHINIVSARMSRTGGVYPFLRVDPSKLAEAITRTPNEFRDFVLTHCVVDLI